MKEKELTIETAMQQIDEAVNKLENTPMLMKESVETYAKAAELLAFCYRELEQSKGTITDVDRMLAEQKSKQNSDLPDTDEITQMLEDENA